MSQFDDNDGYDRDVMDRIQQDSEMEVRKLRNKVAVTIIISCIVALVNYFWFYEDISNWILKPAHRGLSGFFKPDEKLDNARDPGSALHQAAGKGDLDEIEQLLNEGVDIEVKDKLLFTPLHRAAENGNYMAVRLLLDKGANVRAKSKYGVTPLHAAAQRGHTEIVKLLLSRGAKVTDKTLAGDTPMDLAREKGDYDVCKILKDNGDRGPMPEKKN